MSFDSIEYQGPVGQSKVRRSGNEKVAGTATFTAEWQIDGCLHAVAVPSTVARGRIKSIDTRAAEKMPGVRAVLTPENVPNFNRVATFTESKMQHNLASSLYPAAEMEVFHAGQYVAAVIADTFESARDAALLVHVTYEPSPHVTDMDKAQADERPESLFGAPAVIAKGGDAEQALQSAAVKVDNHYPLIGNHHNPIEPHATIAHWSSKKGKPHLTVYDTSQGLPQGKATLMPMFDLTEDQVRVICPYIGGAFGSKGAMWPQTVLACLSAKLVNAPVKVVVTRAQMYGGTGHRSPIRQRVAIGADQNGRIKSIIHSGVATTSRKNIYNEVFTMATRMMYQTDALLLDQKRCRVDTQLPTFMRAPAETPGMFALESAVDELANTLGMDPIELRKRNEPEQDQHSGKPFSGRHLIECMEKGAQQFGWQNRPSVRGRKEGEWRIGMGMAAATYPYNVFPTKVQVTLKENATVEVECCTHEMGTGTVTAQSQLTADLLGISPPRVSMRLGDTAYPPGGISGGSATTASVGGAIRNALDLLKESLLKIAQKSEQFTDAQPEQLSFKKGQLTDGKNSVSFEDLLINAGRSSLSATGTMQPNQDSQYSNHSYGATFVEVGVDEDLGMVRVRRALGCYACGTILNARTGRSQFMGGLIMGVGHALQEATHWDHRYGRITNDNLAEYHVPVNADIPDIDILWIDNPDFKASPIGAKGIGEIGITGVAAAVANAIYNATGKRIRELPITPKLIMA